MKRPKYPTVRQVLDAILAKVPEAKSIENQLIEEYSEQDRLYDQWIDKIARAMTAYIHLVFKHSDNSIIGRTSITQLLHTVGPYKTIQVLSIVHPALNRQCQQKLLAIVNSPLEELDNLYTAELDD